MVDLGDLSAMVEKDKLVLDRLCKRCVEEVEG